VTDLIGQLFGEPEADEADPRERLERLTGALQALAETYEPALMHYKAEGLYGRRIYVPAGFCVPTRVHKQEHFTVALTGECWVVDEQGSRFKVVAPAVFVSPPGTQRACLAVTDVQWLTVHAVAAVDDVSAMTEQLTCKTFSEYQRLALEAQEGV
jgi:quercetin dioxygenase-like cupin family protein